MKAIKIVRGGHSGRNNLKEFRRFMNSYGLTRGEDYGFILNGGKSRRKPTNWATLESVAVMNNDDVLVIENGHYLVEINNKFHCMSETEYGELNEA